MYKYIYIYVYMYICRHFTCCFSPTSPKDTHTPTRYVVSHHYVCKSSNNPHLSCRNRELSGACGHCHQLCVWAQEFRNGDTLCLTLGYHGFTLISMKQLAAMTQESGVIYLFFCEIYSYRFFFSYFSSFNSIM